MKKKQTGFKCSNPLCAQWVSDPWYCGPAGHSPVDLCWECWCEHWQKVRAMANNGWDWTDIDEMLWLVCRGMGHKHAAGIVGRHRNEVRNWILRMRNDPSLIPQWLLDHAAEKNECYLEPFKS